jgi:hypothetical protein
MLVLGRGLWDSPAREPRPWWHSGQDDEQDWRLPAVVILELDYGAELPLTSEEEGMLGWRQTGFPLSFWTDWQTGRRPSKLAFTTTRVAFAATAGRMGPASPQLEAEVRVELGSHAELVVHLWPLQED